MLQYVYIGPIRFPMFFLFGVLGLVTGSVLVFVRRRTFEIAKRDLWRVLFLVVVGVVFGGKLLYAIGQGLMHGSEPGFWTVHNWSHVVQGSVFYGCLFGATTLVLLYEKRRKMPLFGSLTDLMACFAPAAHAVGRIGCLLAGCCYGVEIRHMFTVPGTIYAEPRLPWPLLEAALNLTILAFFLIARPERKRPGTLFPMYLILYSAGRFILEFFRGDASRGVWLLSTSQWIAIALIAAAVVWLRKSESMRTKRRP